ncbi:hypothetical protein H7H51_28895 [Mycolicibacterium farcinogenes]|nr:hypothetical protein [Mycolicibacterium farcinogenes]
MVDLCGVISIQTTAALGGHIRIDVGLSYRDVPPLVAIPQSDVELAGLRVEADLVLDALGVGVGKRPHGGDQIAVAQCILTDVGG